MSRLRAIILKETLALLRDPKGRITLFTPVVIQLLLFSFAATLEVKNADIGLLDRSSGAYSTEIATRIAASSNFDDVVRLSSNEALSEAIDRQEVIAAIVFESDFDAQMTRDGSATMGVILDGRRSNAAQVVGNYIGTIAGEVGAEAAPQRRGNPGSIVVNWFNPNLDFIWFNIPSLAAIIISVSALSITAQSVARERELGTFDQLMVSPLRVWEILVGKMLPPFVLSLINGSVFVIAAPLFGVPFTGSIVLFYIGLSLYALSLIGFGMLVSSSSKTQQQAFLGSFVITVPIVMLSGFAAPIENMPQWLQPVTYAIPARYFLEISLGLFLKEMPFGEVVERLWPLAILATLTLGAAAWLFRARME